MTARNKFDANERREAIFAAAGYRCEVCRMPVRRYGTAQLAHRIPATVANLRKYGEAIIHHAHNLAPVCGLRCNDHVLIGNNPIAREALVDRILAEIEKEKI
jgi:hypothetical protein